MCNLYYYCFFAFVHWFFCFFFISLFIHNFILTLAITVKNESGKAFTKARDSFPFVLRDCKNDPLTCMMIEAN